MTIFHKSQVASRTSQIAGFGLQGAGTGFITCFYLSTVDYSCVPVLVCSCDLVTSLVFGGCFSREFSRRKKGIFT